MKVKIAEDLSEITLLQFQKYELYLQGEPNLLQKIQIFTGISQDELSKVPKIDLEELELLIDKALDIPRPFVNRFKLGDIEFGFIPNFDKVTFAEFKNLHDYADSVEELHKTMAILFRPIKNKFSLIGWLKKLLGKNIELYKIEDYNGTEQYADIMKLMPMNVVTGALFFFLNLSKELLMHTQKFTQGEQAREE